MKIIQVNKVEKLIRYSGHTQKEAAKILNISENTVSRYVTGKVKMNAPRFFEWCEKLGIEDYNIFKEDQ